MTLVGRVEEYLRQDGTWSASRRDALIITSADVVVAVRTVGTTVPDIYYAATAEHESGRATNERDTEPPDDKGVRFQSWGIFQLSPEEAARAGRPSANLLSLADSAWVFVRLTEMRRAMIRSAIGLPAASPDHPDLCPYLAIAHNQGMRACLTTIREHGVDWAAYKARNPRIRIVSSGYGDDVKPRS